MLVSGQLQIVEDGLIVNEGPVRIAGRGVIGLEDDRRGQRQEDRGQQGAEGHGSIEELSVRLAPQIDKHEWRDGTRAASRIVAKDGRTGAGDSKGKRIKMKIKIMKMSRSKIKMKIKRRGGRVT